MNPGAEARRWARGNSTRPAKTVAIWGPGCGGHRGRLGCYDRRDRRAARLGPAAGDGASARCRLPGGRRLVGVLLAVAVVFGLVFAGLAGWGYGGQYFAGYIVEKSLSVDNLFVFVIIMSTFAVPREHQRGCSSSASSPRSSCGRSSSPWGRRCCRCCPSCS